jgi:nucleoside-diphosphate-sugar epimerase
MRAATSAGVRRIIVQSIAFVYQPGPLPHGEASPIASPSVQFMEAAALGTPGVEGVILRYGHLWGPGTWAETPTQPPSLHVDAAAHAAFLAISRGEPGIYNIAEPNELISTAKARELLGFDPSFRVRNH